jgi:hypothetical protein
VPGNGNLVKEKGSGLRAADREKIRINGMMEEWKDGVTGLGGSCNITPTRKACPDVRMLLNIAWRKWHKGILKNTKTFCPRNRK